MLDPAPSRVALAPLPAAPSAVLDRPGEDLPPYLPGLLRVRWLVLASVVLSAVSLIFFRTPTFDVWAWLLWGRESAQLALSTSWGPAFKPLPVAFATLVAPFGSAAPALWLLVARVGGLLAAGAAARLAYRAAGPVAAAIAAVALLATRQYVGYLLPQGMSEPLMVAFALWAVDRFVDGRRETAFWLGVCAGLLRPEIWPFLLGYALVSARRNPEWFARARLLAGLVLLPVAWYLPDYLGSGEPFRQGEGVPVPGGPLTQASPAIAVLRQVRGDVPGLVLLGAALGLVVAVRLRHRLLLGLTGCGAGWIAIVAAMAQTGRSTGVSRYVLPTYAVLAVLAAVGWTVGWTWLVAGLRRWAGSRGSGASGRRARRPVLALAGLALILAGAEEVDGFVRALSDQFRELSYQQGLQRALPRAIAAAGGADHVRSCGRTWTSMYQVTFVAWTLHERIVDVWSLQAPGLPESAYVGPLLQTQDRRGVPVAPYPFPFLDYRPAGSATSAGATWTLQLPAAC